MSNVPRVKQGDMLVIIDAKREKILWIEYAIQKG
jgi:hypothetical protein